ncbi:MAG: DUF2332 domain-containing protein [Novosphingobium sp.]
MARSGLGSGFEVGGVLQAYANQVAYCRSNDATITARVVQAIADQLDKPEPGPFIEKIRDWPGAALADAVPLRSAGGFHALYLAGAAPELAPIYADEPANDGAIIRQIARAHADTLLPWLDGPPQTNEAGRSSGFITAMLWLAGRGLPPRFECLEIGSSAGINLMIDRYLYDLGGVRVGPADAAMRFAPEWRGPPPPDRAIEIASLRGCDVAPIDLTDPAQALRLKAYIWPEHTIRFERLAAAIAAAGRRKPDLVRMNAADFAEHQLALPQEPGTTRLLMHSIVMQYVPRDQRLRIAAAMQEAGRRATADRALAWISLEGNRKLLNHGLMARYWPGGEDWHLLAAAHAHGAWIERFEPARSDVDDQIFF